MLKTSPAVFAVGNIYQIMVEVEREALMCVKVEEEIYYDETNGVMNSLSPLHRVSVPMEALDKAREYTVIIRPIIERKVYFPETEKPLLFSYKFKPVPEKDVRIYHISDAHNMIEQPVAAAKAFGNIDLLILNGDVIDSSGDPSKFANVYEICSAITKGEFPVVFSRGNHDMRGYYAEKFAEYTPSDCGKTYYTFRCGSVWGLVLDCGEDKPDTNEEYGYMVACHVFRLRETEFIKSVIENAEREYAADGVKTKLVICHNPFTKRWEPPFGIEEDLFTEWSALLKEHIKPDLMICGHKHETSVNHIGGKYDDYGQPCPIVVASTPDFKEKTFDGCGIVIEDTQFCIHFTNNQGETFSTETIER